MKISHLIKILKWIAKKKVIFNLIDVEYSKGKPYRYEGYFNYIWWYQGVHCLPKIETMSSNTFSQSALKRGYIFLYYESIRYLIKWLRFRKYNKKTKYIEKTINKSLKNHI